jgi:hypothetical protein
MSSEGAALLCIGKVQRKILNVGNFISGNATAAGINLQIDLSAIFKCLIAL